MFKILAIGDVCGPCGLEHIRTNLWRVRREMKINMVVINAENVAEPNGIDKASALTLFESGADVITTGNHVFRKSCVHSYLDDCETLLRPLNFPASNPGHGSCIVKIDGYRVLCMNVLGSAYMDASACPFESIEACLNHNEGLYDFALVDVHAEATGEKKAIAYNFSRRISACFGTHTHVQTSDACVLDGFCGYITDLGMVGAIDSILGVRRESVIYRLKTKMLSRFDFATGESRADGAVFTLDESTGACVSAEAIHF